MRPWSSSYVGRLEETEITSKALQDNPLGDSAQRPLYVYLPPGYDEQPERSYPCVYVLQGFFGALPAWKTRTNNLRPTYPEMADALFASGSVPPCILVFVDAWTALGGSQFVDSPATGRYHTYLCEDVVPFVDTRYRTLATPAHRGLQGKSSGGFGAMITAMMRPDLFGGFATHAGDALYEYCHLPEIVEAYRALRDHYDSNFDAFFADIAQRPALSLPSDAALLEVYAMAACFSAEPDGTIKLPFDLRTGRIDEAVWARWLSWDPVRMVSLHVSALRSQKAIWVDAGRSDTYHLDLGAQAFVAELSHIGVSDVAFELFEGTHSAIEYRYPLSLEYLAQRLA
jgi:S-formylglutathione hydrolase FrmB